VSQIAISPTPAIMMDRDAVIDRPQFWLYTLFFLSGFPALIYQIVWQRALFTIYGVNVESVTIVVTAFMLGLGLGSLLGGRISRFRLALVPIFAAIELGTSIYGVFSLRLFHFTAQATAGASTVRTGICAFALIVIPTILMGSTLPILVAYLVRVVPNMGRATGMLYFVNTLGSATACFIAGQFTMRLLGMAGSVRLAAGINGLIGLIALAAWYTIGRGTAGGETAKAAGADAACDRRMLPFSAGIVLAAVSGFIALGYEMVWYRVFSWASATNPKTFAFMLGAYLSGLALGALAVEHRCRSDRGGSDHLWFAAVMLVSGNILAALVPPIFSAAVVVMRWDYAQPLAMVVLACAAAMLGTTFPLVCHLTVRPDGRAGRGVSLLYVANIVGSAAGSFIAGYVLTEVLTLPGICTLFATAGIVLGLVLMLKAGAPHSRYALLAALAGAGVLALIVPMYRNLYEQLCFKQSAPPFRRVVENRHGVIAVAADNLTVFGGGIYDGKFNVSPLRDINGITRCYSLFGFLSRPPKHVLMIGLSGGSWAQVVANHPQVEDLTIVEINPGYLKLLPDHPEVASLVHNPKTRIVIDDGHRWLLRNPEAKYDLVIMNTSFFWRANNTNLLSREFLELVARHLKPGGTHFYNTTSSPEAQITALSVFPYAVRIFNFIAVSEAPLRFHADSWRQTMASYRIDGTPVLNSSLSASQTYIDSVVRAAENASNPSIHPANAVHSFESEASLRSRLAGHTVVTDDNMAVEWRGTEP
jgi:spermidine synthase